jgi:hypothetical protein
MNVALRTAAFHLPARAGRASPVGDHPRADARLYGSRFPRREAAWLVEEADRRNAHPIDDRRQPRAAGPACRQPVLPAIRPRTARRATIGMPRKRRPTASSTRSRRMRRASAPRSSGARSSAPKGLERKFGLVGGDIMHGNMSLDQLWSARPRARQRRLSRPAQGALYVRRGHASGRRRHRRAGA